MKTVITSSKKEVQIGKDCPTRIIGERINPTGKNYLVEALLKNDFGPVGEEARRQIKAGADLLDVNVGAAGVDEVKVLAAVVEYLVQFFEVPLVIDSADPLAIEAALKVYHGRALINSVTGEEASLNRILPLVSEHRCSVMGLCMDEKGIPDTPGARIELARKIVRRGESFGIKSENILIDPVVMSVGTDYMAAEKTLETLRLLEKDLGVNSCIGLSNVSFGLPDRRSINLSFLCLALDAGASAIIMDPTVSGAGRLLRATDMLLGKDNWGQRYLADYRSSQSGR